MNRFVSALSVSGIFSVAQKNNMGDPDMAKPLEHLERSLQNVDTSSFDYISGMSLVSMISSIEIYFSDTLVTILKKHPRKMNKTTFGITDVIEKERDELIHDAAHKHIYQIMYMKPMDYLDELTKILSIDKKSLESFWPMYIEAKARRDIGIHNNWVVNDTYLRKLEEANWSDAEPHGTAIYPNSSYLNSTFDNLNDIVQVIRESTIKVFC